MNEGRVMRPFMTFWDKLEAFGEDMTPESMASFLEDQETVFGDGFLASVEEVARSDPHRAELLGRAYAKVRFSGAARKDN